MQPRLSLLRGVTKPHQPTKQKAVLTMTLKRGVLCTLHRRPSPRSLCLPSRTLQPGDLKPWAPWQPAAPAGAPVTTQGSGQNTSRPTCGSRRT